jgi:hypothetical protein
MVLLPEDFYYDPDGKMVLSEKFLLKRGYCCGNGCRHCPYKNKTLSELEAVAHPKGLQKRITERIAELRVSTWLIFCIFAECTKMLT